MQHDENIPVLDLVQPPVRTVEIDGVKVPVVECDTVIVGTGSAGFCAADRLWELGHRDIIMVADKVNAGASRNAGSDKQTYYKLTLSGGDDDSVRAMAETLFSGGSMDGDNALAEAALSARSFIRLCDLGVPFPQNQFGEFVGYKTDHDPRRRATSVGPYTSRTMVEVLEKKVMQNGTTVLSQCRVADVLVHTDNGGKKKVAGLLVLRNSVPLDSEESPFVLFQCQNIVFATGGPAGMYAKRVFPNGQWGASGAAYRAGVHGKNLTEWQFGLASVKPKWNVSGSYMQVVPRFVSTDESGGDEREFLSEAIPDYGRLLTLVFLKGYQWPFDARKAADGSSLIDLLVYRETVLRGRRVFLDFRSNPVQPEFNLAAASTEAREYLERAGATTGTPIQRLRAMNEPAYQFYLDKNPYVDLETQMLEVDLCAQHNNGGLQVDSWWESNVTGFFPVGEAAGSHGVYRPGGAALNSGQVGATRAAQRISASSARPRVSNEEFIAAAGPRLGEALSLIESARAREQAGTPDNTGELLAEIQQIMSSNAGPVRSGESIKAALASIGELHGTYTGSVVADASSRRSIDRLFLIRDILTTAHVYLHAMQDYLDRGGKSRGSVIYTDPLGKRPLKGYGSDSAAELALPEQFKFVLDLGALDGVIQETQLGGSSNTDTPEFTWRPRRPIPEDDDFFENVWREFREKGIGG